MIENKYKRTYTTKVFEHEDGKIEQHFHKGIVHYENKLLLGDGNAQYLREVGDIGKTFVWDENERGWYFELNNFHPWIPEYADDWLEFRDVYADKDQTVRYKPVCAHVKGVLSDNRIIYSNAFGEGIDLEVYETRTMLHKDVVIRTPEVKEYVFEFEMEIPDKVTINCISTDNTRTHVLPLKVWSDSNSIIIPPKFVFIDGKRILQKVIPVSFMEKASGVVRTDTTTNYSSTAKDGGILIGARTSSVSWSTTRNAASCASSTDFDGINALYYITQTVSQVQAYKVYWGGNQYAMQRVFMCIDTSALPSGITISSATLNVYKHVTNWGTRVTETNFSNVAIVACSPANYASIVEDDFDQFGTTRLCDTDVARNSANEMKGFALNSAGISAIVSGGITKLALRASNDLGNTAPVDASGSDWRMSEYSGTSSDPYLAVTYTLNTFKPISMMVM